VLDFPRWKVWIVLLVVLAGVYLSIPSLIAGTPLASRWPSYLVHSKINLGLDLAGGSHLLLEADQRDALKTRLQAKEDEISTELHRDPRIEVGDISTADGRLSFLVRDPTQVDAAVERMRKLSQPLQLTGNRDWDVSVVDSARVVLTPTAADVTYQGVEMWLDTGNQRPVKARFYSESRQLLKTAFYRRWRDELGTSRPTEVVIIDGLNPNLVTVMRYADFTAREIPESWLQRDYLPRFSPE